MRAKPHKWTNEQKEYVHEISEGRYNDEIAKLVNKQFKLNLKVGQIKTFKARHGIRSDVPKSRWNPNPGLFTKAQKDFIKKNVKGLPNEELANLVNETFGLSITTQQILTYKSNNKLSSGLNGRLSKGGMMWNKGFLGLDINVNKESVDEVDTPHNYQPVGTVRVNSIGWVEVKTAKPNVWEKMHHLIWEKAHGPIPKSHVLIFLDGDRQNIALDNLQLITRGELARMNQIGLLFEDSELTKAGINIARVHQKIIDHELRGGMNNEDFAKHIHRAEENGISRGAFGARLRRGWSLEDAINKPLRSKVKNKVKQR